MRGTRDSEIAACVRDLETIESTMNGVPVKVRRPAHEALVHFFGLLWFALVCFGFLWFSLVFFGFLWFSFSQTMVGIEVCTLHANEAVEDPSWYWQRRGHEYLLSFSFYPFLLFFSFFFLNLIDLASETNHGPSVRRNVPRHMAIHRSTEHFNLRRYPFSLSPLSLSPLLSLSSLLSPLSPPFFSDV